MNKGILAAISAYTLWGLLPIYWRVLENEPAIEILAHRIVWSLSSTARNTSDQTMRWARISMAGSFSSTRQ